MTDPKPHLERNLCVFNFYRLKRDFPIDARNYCLWKIDCVLILHKPLPMSAFFYETIRMWFLQTLVFIFEPRGFLRPLFFECLGAHSQIQGMFPILILKFRFRNLFQGMLAICKLFFAWHLIQECQRGNCVKQKCWQRSRNWLAIFVHCI